MWSLLLAGVLALQLCVVKSSSSDLIDCMKIKHEITEDEEYGYRRISIECRVIKCYALEDKSYFFLNTLKLSRKGYGKEDMAILERYRGKDKDNADTLIPLSDLPEGASLMGYTNNIKSGHLVVEWKTNDFEKVDTFTCTMILLNDYYQNKTVSISVEVDLNEPTYTELNEKASSLQKEIDELKGKCGDHNEPIYQPTGEPIYRVTDEPPQPECPSDDYKQKIIETFFGYKVDGDRYYMSSYNFTDDVESGKVCSIVGGYLAEINDEEELKLLIDFVKNSQALGALIGGRYDTDNKKWVYTRSGKDVEYFKWKENKPENPVRKNCMGLWHEYELAEKNLPCDDNMYGLPFICEVENPY